ncbi:MAG: translesion error-prone DNA polymerase V autoproteolytic subunit [Bacteroidota bacterium]
MDGEILYGAAYKGSGQPGQQDIGSHHAGGFSAGDEFAGQGIDLNEQLVRNKPATFFMRVRSDAMINAGIFDGDMVIVDRSLKPVSGKVIIAILNGEMLIRRLEKTFNKVRLLPETAQLSPIEVDTSCNEFFIWGIVTYVIHTP